MCLMRNSLINTRINFRNASYFCLKNTSRVSATKYIPSHFAHRNKIFGNRQRGISFFNKETQIIQPSRGYPPNLKYERFRSAIPFYQKRTFWIYVCGLGGLTGVYYVSHLETVPISNRRRFMDVTPKQEEFIAQQAYKQIMDQYRRDLLSSLDPRTLFVKSVATKLIKVSGMQDLKWEFHVINSSEKNAFVLPGGKIFVFTGILPIVENKDGLAAVLGHEMAHQIARHSAEKLSFVKILLLGQLLLSLIFDPGLIGKLIIDLGVFLPFSRKCESEADYIGLLMMAQACFDPREAIRMWERMKEHQKGVPQFLSTHPNPENRINQIRKWLPEALQKRAESDCVHQYEGFREITEQFRPQWVVW